jgi:hypothetical protein
VTGRKLRRTPTASRGNVLFGSLLGFRVDRRHEHHGDTTVAGGFVSPKCKVIPCRSAAAITASCIRPAMRLHGGRISRSVHWRLPKVFGCKLTLRQLPSQYLMMRRRALKTNESL